MPTAVAAICVAIRNAARSVVLVRLAAILVARFVCGWVAPRSLLHKRETAPENCRRSQTLLELNTFCASSMLLFLCVTEAENARTIGLLLYRMRSGNVETCIRCVRRSVPPRGSGWVPG